MSNNIPQSVIDQFFKSQNIKNVILDEHGYTSQLAPLGDFLSYKTLELSVYRLTVLLSTVEGTHLRDPELGVNLIRYIFKPMDDDNVNAIRDELKRKIARYEKDLRLQSINVKKDPTSKTLYFRLNLKYIPSNEDVVLDFDFVKDIKALMIRSGYI